MQTTRTFTGLCQRHQLFFNEAITLSRSWNIINEHVAVTGDETPSAEGYRWGNTMPGHNTPRQLIRRPCVNSPCACPWCIQVSLCQWENPALLFSVEGQLAETQGQALSPQSIGKINKVSHSIRNISLFVVLPRKEIILMNEQEWEQ